MHCILQMLCYYSLCHTRVYNLHTEYIDDYIKRQRDVSLRKISRCLNFFEDCLNGGYFPNPFSHCNINLSNTLIIPSLAPLPPPLLLSISHMSNTCLSINVPPISCCPLQYHQNEAEHPNSPSLALLCPSLWYIAQCFPKASSLGSCDLALNQCSCASWKQTLPG